MAHHIFSNDTAPPLHAYYERMTEPRLLRATTKAAWVARRGELRERLWEALGLTPLPEKLPLALHTGGLLQREGYQVQRLYWQTWPEVWAGGWLYLPEGAAGRRPAILNPHGHWAGGARHPVVQSRLIALARLGYVALAVDSAHVYDYATGLTPMTVMTWQNLRALEYLISRPDVDRERVGITGASGGAQQAMYLCALDDRIRAGVFAVLASYFRRILMPERHHCPCNHIPGLMTFTDEPELCAAFSPRAALYLTVTGDWTAEFPEQELPEIRAIYRLWGQEDRLAHRQFPGPHDYHREMREYAYGWFARELRGEKGVERVAEPEHTVEEVETLHALEAAPPGQRGPEGIVAWYRKRRVVQPPQLESRSARQQYQADLRASLRSLLGTGTPATLERREHGVTAVQGETAFLISFRSEPEVRLPAVWLPPPAVPGPVVVLLSPGGKQEALAGPLVPALRAQGWGVLAPDLRLGGELRRDWLHNTILWGRPEAGMAADDGIACVDWLWGREEVDPRRVVLVGEGACGIVALLTTALDERVSAAIADCCDTTYRDGGEGLPVIPNVLKAADLPQIAGLGAPRPLWLYRTPADRVGFSSRRYYDWTRRTYQSAGNQEALRMSSGSPPDPHELVEWLETRLRPSRRS